MVLSVKSLNKKTLMKKLLTYVKLFLVLAILLYLFSENKLTSDSFSLINNKPYVFFFLMSLLIFLSLPITTLRWQLILNHIWPSNEKFIYLFRLTIMSQFFALFIPGQGLSDLTKGFYLQNQSNKTKIYLSIILDRLSGLYSVFLVFIILFFFNFDFISKNLIITYLCYSLILLFFTINLCLYIFKNTFDNLIKKIGNKFINEKLEIVNLVLKNITFKIFVSTVSLSLLNQFIILGLFMILNYNFNTNDLNELFNLASLNQISQLATIIPIAPLGIGLGHLSYESLYVIYNFTNGANVFNLFVFYKVILGLIGGIFYIFLKRRG